jgi:hypothetical protein
MLCQGAPGSQPRPNHAVRSKAKRKKKTEKSQRKLPRPSSRELQRLLPGVGGSKSHPVGWEGDLDLPKGQMGGWGGDPDLTKAPPPGPWGGWGGDPDVLTLGQLGGGYSCVTCLPPLGRKQSWELPGLLIELGRNPEPGSQIRACPFNGLCSFSLHTKPSAVRLAVHSWY